MTGNQRIRLVLFIAFMATLALNFPVLKIIDRYSIDGIGMAAPVIFAIWMLLIVACALIVNWRQRR